MASHHLCVGINAYPAPNTLRGCVNDANDWNDLLTSLGSEGSVMLDAAAGGQAILDALYNLLDRSAPGDTVYWTYSGHGTQVPDEDGDETDGTDEAIVPVDFEEVGVITDDLLGEIFGDFQDRGVHLLMIPDSCFSGTVDRALPGPKRGSNRYLSGVKTRPLRRGTGERQGIKSVSKLKHVTLFSGTNDHETAADAEYDGRGNGAFTYMALKALREDNPATLKKWRTATSKLLRGDQHPQVEGKEAKYWKPITFDDGSSTSPPASA